jgi:hypothetical protein
MCAPDRPKTRRLSIVSHAPTRIGAWTTAGYLCVAGVGRLNPFWRENHCFQWDQREHSGHQWTTFDWSWSWTLPRTSHLTAERLQPSPAVNLPGDQPKTIRSQHLRIGQHKHSGTIRGEIPEFRAGLKEAGQCVTQRPQHSFRLLHCSCGRCKRQSGRHRSCTQSR